MLRLHPDRGADTPSESELTAAVWVDLLDPTPEETELVSRVLGLKAPSRESLSEIESSSRLQVRGDVLQLSTPLLANVDTPDQVLLPVGFILSPRRLVTVRYARHRVFEIVAERLSEMQEAPAVGVFTLLLEAIVDRDADLLEQVAAELEGVSRNIFRDFRAQGRRRRRGPDEENLRRTLTVVGGVGARLSEIRATLLGVGRIAPFVAEVGSSWIDREHQMRLSAVRQDIASLDDFETHLANKVQFLLDAVLGFINTEQNELFKVLTIVSVVGVPPTLIASIYGMNFVRMPELDWPFGYPFALVLIVASALLPIVWFKWKRWW